MDDDERAKWEEKRAKGILARVLRNLIYNEKPELANLLKKFYEKSSPYLLEGRHGNPIHHTAKVLEFIVQISLKMNLSDKDLKALLAAAVFHDSGFAKIPKDRKKIKKADIDAIKDPVQKEAKRKEAIELRQEHMEKGANIASKYLNVMLSEFEKEDVDKITNCVVSIIEKHDNPSIAELEDKLESRKQWLFDGEHHEGDPPGYERLVPIHREADRLWMLSIDGIIADLEDEIEKSGKGMLPREKIKYNAGRHEEERKLYEEAFLDASTRFGFKEGCAFYRTPVGQQLFLTLYEEALETFEGIGLYIAKLLLP